MVVATLALWGRGLVAQDEAGFMFLKHYWNVTSYPHHLQIMFDYTTFSPPVSFRFSKNAIPARSVYLEVRIRFVPPFFTGVWLPHWLPMLIFSALPLYWLSTKRRLSRRIRSGQCVNCGYDLRATPEQCPECGTKTKPPPASRDA